MTIRDVLKDLSNDANVLLYVPKNLTVTIKQAWGMLGTEELERPVCFSYEGRVVQDLITDEILFNILQRW